MGILAHSSSRAFVRSDTNVGQKDLARNLPVYPKVVQWGWGSGLCAGQSSSSTPNSFNHLFMDLDLHTGVQFHTIIPPPPNFTVGKMQSGRLHSPSTLQTQTHPSDCQTEKHDSSLHFTKVSTNPESSGDMLYATPFDTWHCTWWCEACMQLLVHGNPFHKVPTAQFLRWY